MEDPWAMVEAAASDRRSGATEIAARAADAVAALGRTDAGSAVEMLLRAHPSMAPLWRLASEVLSAKDHVAAARRFLDQVRADAEAPAILAPTLPDRILTVSFSSTLIEVLRLRRPALTLCMRSEPGGPAVGRGDR